MILGGDKIFCLTLFRQERYNALQNLTQTTCELIETGDSPSYLQRQ